MPRNPSKPFLVVEDEENDVFFLQRTIRKANVENPIQVVNTGDEAIEYLAGRGKYQDREKFPLPSLVFLDLHLAGRLGLEVLTWLRKQPHLDAIIVIL
ncbi:MAG TPA: response regulator, partial [Opitutales bacterium]|nr:response regulator [Opitutales bacterium]